MPACGRLRQKGQDFKTTWGYIETLTPKGEHCKWSPKRAETRGGERPLEEDVHIQQKLKNLMTLWEKKLGSGGTLHTVLGLHYYWGKTGQEPGGSNGLAGELVLAAPAAPTKTHKCQHSHSEAALRTVLVLCAASTLLILLFADSSFSFFFLS